MVRANLAAVTLGLLGCAHAPSGGGAGARAADAALDAASGAHDPAAFARLVCADAVFGGRVRLNEGREAVARAWAPLLDPAGPSLRWAPESGGEATSGDLAWTTGRWILRGKDGESRGEYLTVWRYRGERWCALLDLGLEPPAALGAVARQPLRTARSSAGDLEAELGRLRRQPAGVTPALEGAYLTVRRRGAAGWKTVVDSAVPFAAPVP